MTDALDRPAEAAGIPEVMSAAAARFFAADWEASSFLEFFVDLQLRVAEDLAESAGRTLSRLADHARFALQLTVVRGVDSYFAYLGEIAAAVVRTRHAKGWEAVLASLKDQAPAGVPVDAVEPYWASMAHGNVRQLDRLFVDATGVQLFRSAEEVATISRLVSLRNVIAHGRTFAADDLATLVDETVSVGGLGLRLSEVRRDLDFLRASVTYVDESVAAAGAISRPLTRVRLFEAISAAASIGGKHEASAGELESG